MFRFSLCLVIISLFSSLSYGFFTQKIVQSNGVQLVSTYKTSNLYNLQISQPNGYLNPIQVLQVNAQSHLEAGFHYGYLVIDQALPIYKELMSLLHDFLAEDLLEEFLEWQWDQSQQAAHPTR